jgi:hypothetical protein
MHSLLSFYSILLLLYQVVCNKLQRLADKEIDLRTGAINFMFIVSGTELA